VIGVKRYQPRATVILVSLSLTVFQTSLSAMYAQGRRPSAIERRAEDMSRQREQFERDTLAKDGKPGATRKRRVNQVATGQVRQDFERIQSVYNDIVRALSANAVLDYKFIFKATGEVKKRASRLQANLALPEPLKDENRLREPFEIGEGQMKHSIVTLCKHIVSFVTNPLFESAEILDLELSKKASADLMHIIELSHNINKGADRLHKGTP
jgi:hypothetical protein